MKSLRSITIILMIALITVALIACDEDSSAAVKAEVLFGAEKTPEQLVLTTAGKTYTYDVHTADDGTYFVTLEVADGQTVNVSFTFDGSGRVTIELPKGFVLKTDAADDEFVDGQKVTVLYNSDGKVVLSVSAKQGDEVVTYTYELHESEDGTKYVVVTDESGAPVAVTVEINEENGNITVKLPDDWTLKAPAVSLESIPEPPHVHKFGEWAEVKAPTCTEKGEQARECACGEKETEELAALEHTEGEWVTDKEATCQEKGSKHLECSVCKASLKTEEIDTVPHTSEWIIDKEATCTEKGSKRLECTKCKVTIETMEIPLAAHTYTTKTVDPTKTEVGYNEYTCKCGHSYREEIPATGSLGLKYEVINNGSKPYANITGIGTCTDTELVIPSVIDGYSVSHVTGFSGNDTLKSVVVLDGVEIIEDVAFTECKNIESVVVGEGVWILGFDVFWKCDSLKQITLPHSLTAMKQLSLAAPNLELIIYKGTKAEWDNIHKAWDSGLPEEEAKGQNFTGMPDGCIIRCTDGDIVYKKVIQPK